MIIDFHMYASVLAINRRWLSGKDKILNPAYRQLKQDMAADIRDRNTEVYDGDVQVTVNFAGSQCDIDAPIKATLDILQKARVFPNDKQVRRLVVEITDRDEKPWYAVEVVAYESESTAERLLKKCLAHVYRQQGHGAHEQDREDAKALWDELKEEGYAG